MRHAMTAGTGFLALLLAAAGAAQAAPDNHQKGLDLLKQARALRDDADQVDARALARREQLQAEWTKAIEDCQRLDAQVFAKEDALRKKVARTTEQDQVGALGLRGQADALGREAQAIEQQRKDLQHAISEKAFRRSQHKAQSWWEVDHAAVDELQAEINALQKEMAALEPKAEELRKVALSLRSEAQRLAPGGIPPKVEGEWKEIEQLRAQAATALARGEDAFMKGDDEVATIYEKAHQDIAEAERLEAEAEKLLLDEDRKHYQAYVLWLQAKDDDREAKRNTETAAFLKLRAQECAVWIQHNEQASQEYKALAEQEKSATEKKNLLDMAAAFASEANALRDALKECQQEEADCESRAKALAASAQRARQEAQKLDPSVGKG
jgi:hypothetical protein